MAKVWRQKKLVPFLKLSCKTFYDLRGRKRVWACVRRPASARSLEAKLQNSLGSKRAKNGRPPGLLFVAKLHNSLHIKRAKNRSAHNQIESLTKVIRGTGSAPKLVPFLKLNCKTFYDLRERKWVWACVRRPVSARSLEAKLYNSLRFKRAKNGRPAGVRPVSFA